MRNSGSLHIGKLRCARCLGCPSHFANRWNARRRYPVYHTYFCLFTGFCLHAFFCPLRWLSCGFRLHLCFCFCFHVYVPKPSNLYFMHEPGVNKLCHFIGNILLETFTYTFEWNALKNGVEKAFDNDFLSFGLRDTARLEIEERLLLKLTDCCAVRAADIIRQDFQTRDGICPGTITQDQVPIRLIPVRFLCVGCDVDHALPYRATLAFQSTLEQQIAGCVRGKMILLGIMV